VPVFRGVTGEPIRVLEREYPMHGVGCNWSGPGAEFGMNGPSWRKGGVWFQGYMASRAL
jgi:hypothetical protein